MVSAQTTRARDLKQSEQARLIDEIENELGTKGDHPEDDKILLTSPETIVAYLKARREGWTCRKVMEAYIRSACDIHRKTNCLTEIMFKDALAEADQKDEEYQEVGRAEGDFWGLPSCFKDNFAVEGYDMTLGTSPASNKPVSSRDLESAMVRLYRDAGGIIFCKTNVPQTLLSFECSNPIWGPTSHPLDSNRTCGGSSGGEAVMVTMRGSPIGWGNDIAGSLRIPAHFSGCCSLKPWPGRLPIQFSEKRLEAQDAIKWMAGPMTRNVSDLIFASRAMYSIAQQKRDEGYMMRQRIIPVPWREDHMEIPKKMKIGCFIDEGSVKTSPACRRAVQICVDKLRESGHEVELFEPPPLVEIFKVFVALSSAEGYKARLDSIGPDPLEPSMKLTSLGSKVPWLVHKLIEWAAQYIKGDSTFAEIFAVSGKKSTHEFWQWTGERDNYIIKFFKQVWEDGGYDFLICPVMAVPALRHTETKFLSPLCIFTVLFSMVDSTVGVLPITKVDPQFDPLTPDFLDKSTGSSILEGRTYGDPVRDGGGAYDAQAMDGLPVAVQIVGKPWEEERVLGMMKILEGLVKYQYDH